MALYIIAGLHLCIVSVSITVRQLNQLAQKSARTLMIYCIVYKHTEA